MLRLFSNTFLFSNNYWVVPIFHPHSPQIKEGSYSPKILLYWDKIIRASPAISNNPFPITGIGRCPNISFRIIGNLLLQSLNNFLLIQLSYQESHNSPLLRESWGELLDCLNNYWEKRKDFGRLLEHYFLIYSHNLVVGLRIGGPLKMLFRSLQKQLQQ